MYLGSTDNVQVRVEKEAGNDEIGPNDARRVVWALGVFLIFLIYSPFSLLTNISLILDLRYEKQQKKVVQRKRAQPPVLTKKHPYDGPYRPEKRPHFNQNRPFMPPAPVFDQPRPLSSTFNFVQGGFLLV